MAYLVTDVIPELTMSVSGCPNVTMAQAIRRAARMFCRESWYVLRMITPQVVAGKQDYTMTLPTDEEPIAVKYVSVNNEVVYSGVPEEQDPNKGPERPRVYTFTPPNILSLFPVPDQQYPCFALVPAQPSVGATTLPIEIQQAYHEVVGYGALAFVQEMSGNPWYSPKMAEQNYARFRNGITNAKAQAMRSWSARNLRADAAPFVSRRVGWN